MGFVGVGLLLLVKWQIEVLSAIVVIPHATFATVMIWAYMRGVRSSFDKRSRFLGIVGACTLAGSIGLAGAPQQAAAQCLLCIILIISLAVFQTWCRTGSLDLITRSPGPQDDAWWNLGVGVQSPSQARDVGDLVVQSPILQSPVQNSPWYPGSSRQPGIELMLSISTATIRGVRVAVIGPKRAGKTRVVMQYGLGKPSTEVRACLIIQCIWLTLAVLSNPRRFTQNPTERPWEDGGS